MVSVTILSFLLMKLCSITLLKLCVFSAPAVSTTTNTLSATQASASFTVSPSKSAKNVLAAGNKPFKKRFLRKTSYGKPFNSDKIFNKLSDDVRYFCSKLEEILRSGKSWKKIPLGNSDNQLRKVVGQLMGKIQADIVSKGNNFIDAAAESIRGNTVLTQGLGHGNSMLPTSTNSVSEFNYLENEVFNFIVNLFKNSQSFQRFLKVQRQFSPQILEFWNKVEFKILTGINWRVAVYGQGRKVTPSNAAAFIMENAAESIRQGRNYQDAIALYIKNQPDNVSIQQEALIRAKENWEAVLKSPEYNSNFLKYSGNLEKQAELIRDGFTWWEAKTIIFINNFLLFIHDSEAESDGESRLNNTPSETSDSDFEIDSKPPAITSPAAKTESPIPEVNVHSDIWDKLAISLMNGISWRDAIPSISKPAPNLVNFMDSVQVKILNGQSYYRAIVDTLTETKTGATINLPTLQIAIKGGRDWKNEMVGMDAKFKADDIFGLVPNALRLIVDEITAGQRWADAAAIVLIRNPPF